MANKKTAKSRSKNTKLYSSFRFSRKLNFIFFIAAFVVIGSVIVFSYASPNSSSQKRPKDTVLASVSGAGAVAVAKKDGKTVLTQNPTDAELTTSGKLYCTQENNGTITTQSVSSDKIDFVKTVVKQGLTDNGNVQNSNTPVITATNVVVNQGGQKSKKSYVTVSSGSEKAIADELKSLCAGTSGTVVPIEQAPVFNDDETTKPSASLFDKIQGYVFKPVAATAVTTDAGAANYIFNTVNGVRAYLQIPQLARVACMDSAAYAWSQNMANRGSLYHSLVPYPQDYPTDPYVMIYPNYCGTGWSALAENVAVGSKTNVPSIMNALANSTEHRNNMLNGTYTKTGVGAWDDQYGRVWITQGFWKDAGK